MKAEIEFISAGIEDIDDVYEIEQKSFTDPWTKNGLANALDDSLGIFIAARKNGSTAGYIIGSCDGFQGYIEKTAVSPDFRRCGMGFSLLEAFRNALPETAESISLEVRQSNEAAISMYRKFGFSEAGVRKNFYSSPKENAVVMTITI